MLTIYEGEGKILFGIENKINKTYVGAHTGNKDNASSTLGNHVTSGLPRSEESAVHVDIIQTLDTVEWVTFGMTSASV